MRNPALAAREKLETGPEEELGGTLGSSGDISLLTAETLTAELREIAKLSDPELACQRASVACESVWRSYRENDQLLGIAILKAAFTDDLRNAPIFDQQRDSKLNKQQPSFRESFDETIKRLEFQRDYLAQLPAGVAGAISGGSMSYGRFYNVRGSNPDSSDIDMMLIVENDLAGLDPAKIANSALGFSPEKAELFAARLEEFRKGGYDVLSHKFSLDDRGFDISLHIMPKALFEQMMGSHLESDLGHGRNMTFFLRDYKPANFPHRVLKQRDFTGEAFPITVEEDAVHLGVTSTIPAYTSNNGRLHPGMYHNLVSPLFEVALDRDGSTREAVGVFKHLMIRHARKLEERGVAEPSIAKSHIRCPIFSPAIREEVDLPLARAASPEPLQSGK